LNAYDVLDLFDRHSIGLEVHGDTLRCRAPRGFLTPELRDALTRNKPQLMAILRGGPDESAPLTHQQSQLWFLDQLSPGNPFYNNPMALDLTGTLDVPALSRALTAVVRRHASLRTVFVGGTGTVDGGGAGSGAAGDEPCQVVRPAGPVPLPVTDLAALPPGERDRRATEATGAAARTPFDLAAGPPLRAELLRLAADQHRLLLTVHHIVADGWSIGILLRDLAAIYAADVRGEPVALPGLHATYADHARSQRRHLRGATLRRQLDHWTARLHGAPELLALPTDRPRPAVQRFRGHTHQATVGADVAARLRAVGNAHGATLFMTLTAALSVLLWRYSGQDDVCVGTPFANRGSSDVEDVVGHFVNTLVLRTTLRPEQPFDALLRDVRDHVLDAYAHPDVPFDHLVDALRPRRHTSHSPLFQVMLVLQNMPRARLELPGLVLRARPTSAGAAKFDLAVEVATDDTGGLSLTVDHDTDLFDTGTIERLADHFVRLVEHVAADPSRPVGRLPLLGRAERRRHLHEWNATTRPPAGPTDLVTRIHAQVDSAPDRPAVVEHTDAGPVALTFGELDRRANRLAHALMARGVRPDQPVGLHVGRTTALLVGIVGILKAGAAYLPLDPTLPPRRLTDLARAATLVLTDEPPATPAAAVVPAGAGSAPAAEGGPEWVSQAGMEARGVREDRPGVRVRPGNLAYVIHTSGSTGRPKGVAVGHAAVTNLLDDWVDRFGALPGTAASAWCGIGFDVSVHELLLPLTTGATVHLVPEDLRGDPDALMEWLRRNDIVQAYLPPAFVTWIEEAPAERLAGLALRHLLVGVEPLPEDGLHRLTRHLPGLRVLNGYGPTETTVYSTGYADPLPLRRQCPIGRPLANTRVHVLDPLMEPVPVGVTGELHIGGAGLARGYLDRPDLTAERFVADPFTPGERLYRTGDLARRLPDGTIEHLGRLDHQVKLRGFRIEPGEIEAALLDQPGVREAVVLLDHDPAGEPRLVAGIGRGAAEPRPAAEWRAALAQRLPGHMIPALFVELPALPHTVNGKLDRDALLAHARATGPAAVNQSTPRDHVELALYTLWKTVLLHPDIGIRDSFFDVGGTSVSAIKLAAAVREEFGRTLPVRDLMLHPTIEELAALLRGDAAARAAPVSNLVEFRAGAGARRVVCVHPAGGTAFCYLALARALPDTVGVYGIQSPGVNHGETALATVEDMARAYLRLIEPTGDGPLVLTGLSYGGLVAHEMGRLLVAAGHPSVSVVLLDTLGTDDPAARAAIAPVDLAEFRDKLVRFNGMYPGIDDAQLERYFRIYNHNRLTMRDHVALPTAGRLVLLQATAGRDDAFLAEVRAFWGRRAGAGGLHVQTVHCDHWELLESAEVATVTALLTAELDRLR
jgi:amino acid adenylation domain-containing protein